jgi:AAA family ATP:ADP antiporter
MGESGSLSGVPEHRNKTMSEIKPTNQRIGEDIIAPTAVETAPDAKGSFSGKNPFPSLFIETPGARHTMGVMPGWLLRLVDVRPGELRRVGSMFSLLGLIITTSYILKPVRSSLFLSQFGSERLPYVYILVALVLGVVAAAFARWAPQANLTRMFAGAAYFFAANLVFFWLATSSGWAWTGFVFYVWVSIFTALMPSLFWLLANYVFYSNEGRRLFPVVMAGGLLGSIVGGALTSLLVLVVGTPGLLLTAAAILVAVASLIGVTATHERERMSERRSEIGREEKSRFRHSDDKPWTLVARSRYLSMLAVLITLTTTTSTLVDYQFNTIVEQSFATMDALTGFFGIFFAGINVIAFVLQLVVVGRLLGRFGVAAGLVLLPFALLGSSIAFLLIPQLVTAALIKSADDGLSNSVNKASVEVLYLPISLAVKNRLKAWLDMFVERISRGVAGATILVATTFFSLSPPQMSFIVIALLIPWTALAFFIQREYVEIFRDSLRRRDISDFASQLRDQASLSLFHQVLETNDERELVYALELASGIEDPTILERVVRLSSHESAAVRTAALRFLRGASEPPLLRDFDARAHDDDPAAAAEALALWVEVEPERGYQALLAIVQHGDTERVDAILDRLELSERLVSQTDVEAFVKRRYDAPEATTRRLAARAAAYLHPQSGALTCLPKLVQDDDIDVARAAATAIGSTRYEPAFPLLVSSLGRRAVRVAARKAISRFGIETINGLGARFRDEAEELNVRLAIPLVIAQFDDNVAIETLFASLPRDDRRLQYQGIKGLGKLRSKFPNLRFSRSEVERLLKGEASQLAALTSLHSGVAGVPAVLESHSLLLRVLDERLEFTRERIFRLLGLVYPADAMFSAFNRIATSRPAVRASALEYLSNVLSKSHRAWILPLIETNAWADVHVRTQALFGSTTLTFDEALSRLVRHRDAWIAATAVTVVAQLDASPIRAELESIREHPSPLVREAVEGALRVAN